MPCERKHIEAIEEASCIVASCMNGHIGWQLRSRVVNLLHTALAACDESPCVWKIGKFSQDYVPGCAPETSSVAGGWRYVWGAGFRRSMIYCPHCGRKIAPLPAAPEVV